PVEKERRRPTGQPTEPFAAIGRSCALRGESPHRGHWRSVRLGGHMIEHAGQSYRQLAEEIGAVLQAAAKTAEKIQAEAHADAARLRAEAEADRRAACEEGRRILDEARMEADMVRAEAAWQAQETLAQAGRQASAWPAPTPAWPRWSWPRTGCWTGWPG